MSKKNTTPAASTDQNKNNIGTDIEQQIPGQDASGNDTPSNNLNENEVAKKPTEPEVNEVAKVNILNSDETQIFVEFSGKKYTVRANVMHIVPGIGQFKGDQVVADNDRSRAAFIELVNGGSIKETL